MNSRSAEAGQRSLVAFELAVQDIDGLGVAGRVDANRIELCSALALGGLTPSRALIDVAVAGAVPVHVLIRPRGGDFDYSLDERALIVADAAHAAAAGAAGIVVGATAAGAIDVELTRAVIDAVGHLEVTFHRAFDVVADRSAALDQLVDLGLHRVLTSGGAASAPEGVNALGKLVVEAASRIHIMAGGGVTSATARRVLSSGVHALHASAKAQRPGAYVVLGSGPLEREVTDEAEAHRLRRIIDEHTSSVTGRESTG